MKSLKNESYPLNPENVAKIEEFVGKNFNSSSFSFSNYLLLYKTLLKPCECPKDWLAFSRSILGAESFDALTGALREPRRYAKDFGLSAHPEFPHSSLHSRRQDYAVFKCIESVLRGLPGDDYRRRARMGEYDVGDLASLKHKLLAQEGIPTTISDPWSFLRSRILYETPGLNYVRFLQRKPALGVFLRAFVRLLREEKGHIIVANTAVGSSSYGFSDGEPAGALYNAHHTIYIAKGQRELGLFMHEAMHFVIGRLGNGSGDPAYFVNNVDFDGEHSPKEKEAMDITIAADCEHLKSIENDTSEREKYFILDTGVSSTSTTLFGPQGLDPDNRQHCAVLRAEMIRRIKKYNIESVRLEALFSKFRPHILRVYRDQVAVRAKEFDNVLEKDRKHRDNFAYDALRITERHAWNIIVDGPLKYFANGFNSGIDEHLQIMRIETIVRVNQCFAENISQGLIHTIAPNLLEYYRTQIEPRLKGYADNRID